MFFEGPEKKMELVVSENAGSLRKKGRTYWEDKVKLAGASILSEISNDMCDAYLLSESSLFVYDEKLIFITCGRTQLVQAVCSLITDIGSENIDMLVYERKSEHFPEYQVSNFFADIKLLSQHVSGKAFRFGEEDGHHIYLYHMDKKPQRQYEDMTLEILMHGVDMKAAELFCNGPNRSLKDIHERSGVGQIFPNVEIDDYLFEPMGYSLNAIRDDKYYTFHVTPEKIGSYVSFETNFDVSDTLEETSKRVLEIFKPESCDIMVFSKGLINAPLSSGYQLRKEISQSLNIGFNVQFYHYFLPQSSIQNAHELEI